MVVTLRHLTGCLVSWVVMFMVITQSLTESRTSVNLVIWVLMFELESYHGVVRFTDAHSTEH